ncbi:hypothetical protein WCU81_03745 [Pectobacterium atrosepticum]|nr:hypothetical protein [Pectobacterium atrosepticum]KMK78913.1 hypothetical protein KCQ_16132 [Pectobacterium atrosepticum ICMP 1526]
MTLSQYQAEDLGQKKRWLKGRPPCVLARNITECWIIAPVV